MVLSLESPIGPNFIKDFPGLNAINSDDIDNYAGPCLTSHAIQSYTPSLTATVTNPVIGTPGTLVGKYYKIFDEIWTWGEFRFGNAGGVTAGSGTYRISLPFKAKTNISSGNPYNTPIAVGTGRVFSVLTDANRQAVTTMLGSPDFLVFRIKMATGGASSFVTHNIPITWSGSTPGDGMMWAARYQRDPN